MLIPAIFVGLFLFVGVGAPPVDKAKPPAPPPHPDDPNDQDAMFQLEYTRYLQEIVQTLESDAEFKKILETMDPEDIKQGKLADHLDSLPNDVRDQLHEKKRQEVERLRDALRKQMELDPQGLKMPEHIDHSNLKTFEKEDLKKLIQKTTQDLDDLDKERQKKFKEYEMKKEVERRHKMAKMNEEERKKAEQEFKDSQQRHKEHPKLKHPGSKAQLEEVWQQVDDLPKDSFDSRTFFNLHDTNGDGNWDDEEVEALFQKELDKMYNESNSDDDFYERMQEMYNMREHFVNQIDRDKDGIISFKEFMTESQTEEFKKDEGWKGLDEQEVYSEDELNKFQDDMVKQYGWDMPPEYGGPYPPGHPQGGVPHPQGGGVPHPQGAVPQAQQFQGLPQQQGDGPIHAGVPQVVPQGQAQHDNQQNRP